MVRESVVLLVVVLLAVPAVGGSPPGSVGAEPPQFEVTAPGPALVAGATQPLTLQIVNDADDPNTRVKNATNVEVDFLGVEVIEPVSDARFVGRLVEGRPRTVTTRVRVDEKALGAKYDVPVAITYEYVNDSGQIVEERKLTTVTVEVEARPRFEVKDVESNVSVGTTGTVSVTVENVGSAPARSASVTLQTASSSVSFGRSTTANRFVGRWEAGEARTLTYDVTVADDAETRSYTLQGTVNYEDDQGVPTQSAPLRFGITPGKPATFSLSNLDPSLEVGERGTIEGTVTNTGDSTVENAVVLLEGTPPSVTPVEPQYAVGTLEPGESASFDVEATVSPRASAGPRQFTFRVTHRTADGGTRASDPKPVRIRIGPEQTFAVENVSTDLRVGAQGTITGTVVNTGDRTVENAVVVLTGTSPMLRPVEPEYAVGTLTPGERVEFELAALATPEATAGPRQLTMRVQYSGEDGSPRASDPKDVRVQVDPEQSFDVRNVQSTLRVGEEGTIRGTVVNTGNAPVENAVVVFQSSSPLVTPLETEYAVGRLGAGESASFAIEAQVSPRASVGPRQFDFRVQYRNQRGRRGASDLLTGSARVAAGQSFAVENVESSLRIGAEGTVSGTLVNTGNRTVENVVVAFQSSSPTLTPVEPEYAIGTIEPGERVEFAFDVEVSESADSGPRQVTFLARYRSEEGEPRSSDPLDTRVSVSGKRDTFSLGVVDGSIEAGGNGILRVRVRNDGAQRLTDVSAKVYDGSPLSATDDEAFVESLAPGETTTLTFEVGVASGAIENKTYPMQLDFRYDDADGEKTISDIYRVPVRVQPSSDSGGSPVPVPLVVGLVLVVVVAGYLVYRRRN